MKLLLFLARYSKHLRYSRIIIVSVIIAGVAGGAAATALLALINTALTRPSAISSTMVLTFIALSILIVISRVASQILLLRFTTGAIFDLRMKLCRRMVNLPLRQLEESGAHRLLAVLTDDLPNIITALTSLPLMCTQAAIVICSAVYLAWLSWKVFLVIFGLMFLGGIIYRISVRKTYRYMELAREQWNILLRHFRGLMDGAKELKLHSNRREEFFSQNLEGSSIALRHYRVKANSIFITANSYTQIISSTILGLLLFVFPRMGNMNTEIMTGYTLIFFYMLNPLQTLLTSLPGLSQAKIAVTKVEELGFTLKDDALELNSQKQLGTGSEWSELELAGVVHSYHRERENSNFIVGPIDLTINRNELVFVIGGNGSGKTTLVKLLTGLYIPESGEIRLDGQPVNEGNRDAYRQNFSVVFTDFYLFDSFLGLGAPELDAQAEQYLTRFQLNHKVQVKDGVLSTTELSQGQRKRLALLTAYLENRSIYVFDEWAADQDPEFKEIFYYQLLPDLKARGKTVIVISHDDRYYHVADRLIKLDYGTLAADTANEQLPYVSADVQVPVTS
ncbi:MAG TPA: cyclic peptide export ABC transporter [Pyrinomonadaceae bacterium]|jgi:putative ATP-binding cassette transporter